MSTLATLFNKIAIKPVHTFRAVFPAWKNGWEAIFSSSKASDAFQYGIIAGAIAPVTAATTEKIFNYIPALKNDDILGNSIKTLKSVITPAAASAACFQAVTWAKTGAATNAIADISTKTADALNTPAGHLIAGSSLLIFGAVAITRLTYYEHTPPEERTPSSIATNIKKIKNSIHNNVQEMSQRGVDHYRIIFPANLTFLSASIAEGFSTSSAIGIGALGGIASVKTANFIQKQFLEVGKKPSILDNTKKDGLLSAFNKIKVPVATALCASTAAVTIPAAVKPIISYLAT